MSTNTPIERLFNNAVASAKSRVTENLVAPNGYYSQTNRQNKVEYDINKTITYSDVNNDNWIDKITEKSGTKTIVFENTNPNKDKLFDYYAEYSDGKLTKEAIDRDKNGKYDLVNIYDNGILTQSIEDITGDETPEIYTFYNRYGEAEEVIDTRSIFTKILDKILSREVKFD